jgi:hypothetical protein
MVTVDEARYRQLMGTAPSGYGIWAFVFARNGAVYGEGSTFAYVGQYEDAKAEAGEFARENGCDTATLVVKEPINRLE